MKLIIFLLIFFAATSATAAVTVSVVEDPSYHGCPPYYPFKEDNLLMVVTEGKKKIATYGVCSSYGTAEAHIEKDAKGNPYIFLKYGEGRGTNAREEYLKIFTVSETLTEYLRLPLTGPAGPFSNWHYDYSVTKPKDGGFSLRLRLKVEGEGAITVPAERTKSINIK